MPTFNAMGFGLSLAILAPLGLDWLVIAWGFCAVFAGLWLSSGYRIGQLLNTAKVLADRLHRVEGERDVLMRRDNERAADKINAGFGGAGVSREQVAEMESTPTDADRRELPSEAAARNLRHLGFGPAPRSAAHVDPIGRRMVVDRIMANPNTRGMMTFTEISDLELWVTGMAEFPSALWDYLTGEPSQVDIADLLLEQAAMASAPVSVMVADDGAVIDAHGLSPTTLEGEQVSFADPVRIIPDSELTPEQLERVTAMRAELAANGYTDSNTIMLGPSKLLTVLSVTSENDLVQYDDVAPSIVAHESAARAVEMVQAYRANNPNPPLTPEGELVSLDGGMVGASVAEAIATEQGGSSDDLDARLWPGIQSGVTVTDRNGVALEEGKDYSVDWFPGSDDTTQPEPVRDVTPEPSASSYEPPTVDEPSTPYESPSSDDGGSSSSGWNE